MSSSAVTLQRVGLVALITINRPDKLNALNLEVAKAFGEIVAVIIANAAEYGAVVVTGAGRAFSAGGDLDWLRLRGHDTPSRNAVIMFNFYQKFLQVRKIPLPTICAINGHAIGAGLCFAMACDIRIVSAKAKLGFTFVGLGLHPGMGATHLIASVVGFEVAYQLLLTGSVISGTDAKNIQLVSQVAADGSAAQNQAMALAQKIASQSPISVRTTVRSLRMKQDIGLEQALWREADAQAHGYGTQDYVAGVEAIAQKRVPVFLQYESYADNPLDAKKAGLMSRM